MTESSRISRGLLGDDVNNLLVDLLYRAKLDVLFEGQQIGKREPSAASSGTMLYAAGMLPDISDSVLRPFFEELASLVTARGTVEISPGYRVTVETNWADAWCLAAFSRRPHLVSEEVVKGVARSICDRQERSGGWSVRHDRPGRPHPLFCFPVSLAIPSLRSLSIVPPIVLRSVVANLVAYLRGFQDHPHPLINLLANRQLRVLGVRSTDESADSLHSRVWRAGHIAFESLPLGRDDQPLWYTVIDRPLMFLCTRKIWPIMDPINVSLATEVLDSFDSRVGGWKNSDNDDSPCTWRTALSLLAVDRLCHDLASESISMTEWHTRQVTSARLVTTDGFDVGISFSSTQREIAGRIRGYLRKAGLTVFYDQDYQHELLGAELNVYLHDTYFRRCRYAVAVLSQDFVRSTWSGGLEWRAILSRLQEARSDFLLPYFVESVDVPGLSPSIGFLTADTHSPEEFAEVVVRKVLGAKR